MSRRQRHPPQNLVQPRQSRLIRSRLQTLRQQQNRSQQRQPLLLAMPSQALLMASKKQAQTSQPRRRGLWRMRLLRLLRRLLLGRWD